MGNLVTSAASFKNKKKYIINKTMIKLSFHKSMNEILAQLQNYCIKNSLDNT